MSKEQEIISDAEIDRVHDYFRANFGGCTSREVVRETLLKRACGYWAGYTANAICIAHKLITPKTHRLTQKGQQYLWAAYGYRSSAEQAPSEKVKG